MGQTLSEPITSKDTKLLSNKDYLVGASSMQGWRISILLNIEIMQVDMLIFLKWISLSSRPSFLKASIPLTWSQGCLIKRVSTECRKYHWHMHCSYKYVYSYKYIYWWQWFSFLHFHCSYELWICLFLCFCGNGCCTIPPHAHNSLLLCFGGNCSHSCTCTNSFVMHSFFNDYICSILRFSGNKIADC